MLQRDNKKTSKAISFRDCNETHFDGMKVGYKDIQELRLSKRD